MNSPLSPVFNHRKLGSLFFLEGQSVKESLIGATQIMLIQNFNTGFFTSTIRIFKDFITQRSRIRIDASRDLRG